MVSNEHNLNMFDTLHIKCLIKCLNDNYIDYLVSLGYGNDGNDVNCSLIKCILIIDYLVSLSYENNGNPHKVFDKVLDYLVSVAYV
jgi:hypothetical protein